MAKIRKAFVMEINPGVEDEYRRRHDELWPEMHEVLKSHGVTNYSIYLSGTTLYAYAEIADESAWASLAEEPVVRKWWDHMADIMKVNDDNSPVAVDLEEMFHLD